MLIYFLEAGCVRGAQNDVGAFPIFIVSQGFICFAAKQKNLVARSLVFFVFYQNEANKYAQHISLWLQDTENEFR